MRRFLFIALTAGIASFVPAIYAENVRVEGPSTYTYRDDTLANLRIRGSYGRYLRFIGRAPVQKSGYWLPGSPGGETCTFTPGFSWKGGSREPTRNCSTSGGTSASYIPPSTIHQEWDYEIDCLEKTFDRRGDELAWMNINNDPVANTVFRKYCPKINTLTKVFRKGSKYYLDESSASNLNSSSTKKIDYFELAYAKSEKGDHKGAISDYTKAIKLKPDYAIAYNNRGSAKYDLGDKKGACSDYKKAASLGGKSTKKWLNSDGGSWCRNKKVSIRSPKEARKRFSRSRGNYNSGGPGIDSLQERGFGLSIVTLKEMIKLIDNGWFDVAGAYHFTRDEIVEAAKLANLALDKPFDKENQEKLADAFFKRKSN